MFSQFFSAFPKSAQNLEYFEKQDQPQRLFFFRNYRLQNVELLKWPKSPVSEHLWTVNMLKGLKGPNHFLNLHSSIFDIFFDHSEKKSARKTVFQ